MREMRAAGIHIVSEREKHTERKGRRDRDTQCREKKINHDLKIK